MSIEEIYQEIEKIVENFNNLECYQCAQEILKWLKLHQIKGTVIRLSTKYDEDFIVSTRLENLGITESITANGTHYGVEVQGIVFDNLAITGMSREDWLRDFHCPSEQFIVEELEDL